MSDIDKNVTLLKCFFEDLVAVEEVPIGHINKTYLVKTGDSRVVAQVINSKVFNIRAVANNLELIHRAYLKHAMFSELIPAYLPYRGSVVCFDKLGQAWKFTEYLENSVCRQYPNSENEAFMAGCTLSKFHEAALSLPTMRFRKPIPGFFAPFRRIKAFKRALNIGSADRVRLVKKEVDRLERLNQELKVFFRLLPFSKKFICHYDTKFENFLVCPQKTYLVDHDLVQVGFHSYDVGDFLRTVCFKGNEDDPKAVEIDKLYLESAVDGLRSISYSEKFQDSTDLFAYAPCAITYILCLRFMTDFLEGDQYFRIHYAEQNFFRGLCQLFRAEQLLNARKLISIL
ncbi:MAG: aminoglycoside phosphotransferase family protein [Deltaproteobacteria bacterium]|nr:aminoglycoside phosphotransferase family protein [Deltaproteobacteria bacterium]